jgi:DNA-binding NarL/FixJ family response regulator
MSVRLLVLDDHEVVRRGLMSLMQGTEIEIVAEAGNSRDALRLAEEFRPDVVLMDVRLANEDDVFESMAPLLQRLPGTRVIFLSSYDNPTYMARAITWGASDYVLKGTARAVLIDSIRTVARGEQPAHSEELRRVTAALSRNGRDEILPELTRRETQVLRHVALGLSNKEIARSLDVSVETVKEHVQNMLRKLSLTDRTQAAVWAVRQGWV